MQAPPSRVLLVTARREDLTGRRERRPTEAHSQLCFNFHNRLVQRLSRVRDRNLLGRSVQMLYIQALLLGHHPLSSKEMALLNDGLLSLIESGIRE